MLLITHDLGIVAQCCDKVAIMYAGEIVEYGTAAHIFKNVKHPYTEGLFGSLPSLDKDVERLSPIRGLMPDPANLPDGCKFHERCPKAIKPCVEIEPGHFVKCLLCGGQISGLGERTRKREEEGVPFSGKREKMQRHAEGRKLGEKKPGKDRGGAEK
jgi:peptide/nickel transport system ATP-binding protein